MAQIADISLELKKEVTKGNFIRQTQSICPECNRILPAIVFERDAKVWMTKTCPEHGETEELYFGSYEMYSKFSRYWRDGKGTHAANVPLDVCSCPANCGLCSNHLSHTGLSNIIVTNRCDLTCWYCFFYVKKGLEGAYVYEPTLDQVREMARALKSERPVAGNSVQITGGEPTIREDLPTIIKIMKEEGVDHIQLNTNGINLALNPGLAKRLKEAGVSNLYMSFDGVTPKTNPKNHWEAPYAIDACRKVGVGVVLVPTVIKSINDHELGDIIRFGQRNIDTVHAVNFQPVSLTGRLTKTERAKYRITIPDCIERIEEQTSGEIPKDGWFPVPSCSPVTGFIEAFTKKEQYELSIHFACGAGTYVFNDPDKKKLVPLPQFVDIPGLIEYLDEKRDEIYSGTNRYIVAAKVLTRISSFVDKEKQPKSLSFAKLLTDALVKHDYSSIGQFHLKSMFLGMMHFQDKFNQDEERLQRCDIHYLTPDLRIIPFCSFNVIPEWYRDRIQQKYGLPIEVWEAKTGRKLEEGLYRGTLRRGAHVQGCGCGAGEHGEPLPIQPITGT
ncbi:MAG TPA: radical SAM protein [Nitrososphaerales archaeon]|nr:radical SAM protein [Nitrososphaerales archaeon]